MTDRMDGMDETLPFTVERHVNEALEHYEAAWRRGERPLIEAYVATQDPPERAAVLRGLVALDAGLRRERGESPAIGGYLGRFPDDAAVVGQALGGGAAHASDQSTRRLPPGPARALASTTPGPPTSGLEPTEAEPGHPAPARDPDFRWFGRYRVIRLLGHGSFGQVYLADDADLHRKVAIKVPNERTRAVAARVEALLAEARLAAGLKHPAIVAVHDLGRDPDGVPYVVFEYVEGSSLADLFERGRPSPDRLARVLARVAEAVHHAHRAGLVHRDLKPSNIMIDPRGEPLVADFGLAISEGLQGDRSGELAGTPSYMAPEQVRGETHRLDGRTDIWALGVILYQGLTGRVPFLGRDRAQLFDEILHRDPRPPRQVDDSCPRELERICLKCLSRRMTDRYHTAADLAEELTSWPASSTTPGSAGLAESPPSRSPTAGMDPRPAPAPVIPKGLRSFDAGDADFYPDLLPGPRGRDGVPESIRFWKSWAESRGEAATPVGLLYGPSGCGKSSMVRAGLLERLDPSVVRVYLEATTKGTEAILREALHRRFPGLAPGGELPQILGDLRAGAILPPGGKVLIVLDQFEQWLHVHQASPDGELIRALRQCDGERVQALILVRDDFWMAVTRFFQALEVPLSEGRNSATVELFDAAHARRVLVAFGRAYGCIPGADDEDAAERSRFLDRAVAESAGPDGRVIPVRLALLAEMLRHRRWVPSTLRALGGFEGIGETFLEETFGGSAPPTHRLHAGAAQAVLRELIPPPGGVLKGEPRTDRQLREASGYEGRPADFEELMRILEAELRMVNPVDPQGLPDTPGGDAVLGETSYQLAHDYLVPSLRSWLTRKQRETRRGRAELRLASIANLWRERPEPRFLPSPAEWLEIAWDTRRDRWSDDERRVMRAATRRHLAQIGAGLAVAAVLAVAGWLWDRDRRAEALYHQALRAEFADLGELVEGPASRRAPIRDRLERLERNPAHSARDEEVAAILLYRDDPGPRRAALLVDRLFAAEPRELAVIAASLASHPGPDTEGAVRAVLADHSAAPGARLRAACALARIGPDRTDFRPQAPAVAEALLREDRRSLPRWVDLLGPALETLLPPLERAFGDPSLDAISRAMAAEALADALGRRGDSRGLARVVVGAPAESFLVLVGTLSRRPELLAPVLATFEHLLDGPDPPEADAASRDRLARIRAIAATAMLALGRPEPLWPRLRHHEDPRLRGFLIESLARQGLDLGPVLDRLRGVDVDPVELQALLLVFSEASRERGRRGPLDAFAFERAIRLYLNHPDPGVHSAAELLLRRLGGPEVLDCCDAELRDRPAPPASRDWLLGPNGHTLAVRRGPVRFWMGSPGGEPGRYDVENRHYRQIDRSFAAATAEVTLEQFRSFRPGHGQDSRYGPDVRCPANTISWFEAARYCNWLSEQAGIPKEQWVYPEALASGVEMPAGVVEKYGFRLPTEAEWEYACRARTLTARPFGDSEDLLSRYAWTWLNSRESTWPVGQLLPNQLGLFDILGNNWEWCHDGPDIRQRDQIREYPRGTPEAPARDPVAGVLLRDGETYRNARGGAHSYAPSSARSAKRYPARVNLTHPYMGFRVFRTLRPDE